MRTLFRHRVILGLLLGLALGAPLRAQDGAREEKGATTVTAQADDGVKSDGSAKNGDAAGGTKSDNGGKPAGGDATTTKPDDAGKADGGKTDDAGKTGDGGKPATPAPPASGGSPFGFLGGTDTRGDSGPVPMDAVPDKPVDPDKVEVSVAFTKAEISNVLNFLSMASGVPIVADGEIKGQVTITSLKKVNLTLAFQVINSALRVRGYAMIGTLKDPLIRVVTLKKALADKTTVKMGADPKGLSDSDYIITQVVPLQFVSAAKLKDELKPLVADDQANLTASASTNSLIVTDTEGNIKRLLQVVALLDKDTTDIVEVEIYACKNAMASVIIQSLEKVFDVTKTTTNIPGMPPQPQPQPGAPGVMTDTGVMSLRGSLKLATDDRTNSLIIAASRQKIKMVLELVKQLDIDTKPEVHSKIFPLKYADANLVATQLNKLFQQPDGGSRNMNNPYMYVNPMMPNQPKTYAGMKENLVVADVRTNSIVVTATSQNMREYEEMIKQLDAPTVLSDITRVFALKYAKAKDLESTLSSLFRGQRRGFNFWDLLFSGGNNQNTDGDPISQLRNITVVAEEKSNSLLITGPPQTFNMVEQIIERLDKRTVQVFIEVAIVDVSLNDSTKFGVEWNWASKTVLPDKSHKATLGTDLGLASEPNGFRYNIISDSMQALLHAMKTDSNVKVYSTPSITTADNVQAKISIGSDQPFVSADETTTSGGTRRTVAFKNVSIALTVTPHVNEASNLIGLDVQQTINELMGREPTLNAPIVANREAKTTVMVNDGQTIVIGGIIKENKDREMQGVPWVSRIPLVGELFKRRTNTGQKSELMVFITPHILRDDKAIADVTNDAASKITDPPKEMPGRK
jgi:general secretion pathway protein D